MTEPLTPRQQGFLEMLSERAKGGTSPAVPPPALEGTDPSGAPDVPTPESGAPLTFEQAPPAPDEVPPALNALADEAEMVNAPATESWEDTPRADAPLMDLGADAQQQGRALAVKTIASRLAAVIRDLGTLDYIDQATELVPSMEWAVEEHDRLIAELEQRGKDRRGEEE